MAIYAAMPVSRELALASAASQTSLTRRDRELHVAEECMAIEVAEAVELGALLWHRREELSDKWRKRKQARPASSRALVLATDTRRQLQKGAEAEAEEEETGTLFDDRS